jgi:hypothetical protein
LAQAHAGAAQAVPVPDGDVELAAGTQVGQWYAGQQVIGSTPSLIGVAPSGQAIAIAGQRTRAGSQVVVRGTHLPAHVWPEQFPFASHLHDGSVAGHAQTGVGGTLVPVDGSGGAVPPPVVVPPAMQPQPEQLTSQA